MRNFFSPKQGFRETLGVVRTPPQRSVQRHRSFFRAAETGGRPFPGRAETNGGGPFGSERPNVFLSRKPGPPGRQRPLPETPGFSLGFFRPRGREGGREGGRGALTVRGIPCSRRGEKNLTKPPPVAPHPSLVPDRRRTPLTDPRIAPPTILRGGELPSPDLRL